MATLLDILRYEFPDRHWTMHGVDDYAGLEWYDQTLPKPSENELRALSDSADAKKIEFDDRQRAERMMADVPDPVLRGFEVVINYLEQLHAAVPASIRDQINPARVVRMRDRLRSIRADPGD